MARVAQRAEELGYRRIWYPEHHGSSLLPDRPPAVAVAHVAAVTSHIRVGSGGVLAAYHVPLSLAEQFRALAALHPGRIDVGIGRGPGSLDEATNRALRCGEPAPSDEEYTQSVDALLELIAERSDIPAPWLLSSSQAGARHAAERGLPIAFAHHIRPQNTAEAVQRYRDEFKTSRWREEPWVMLSVPTICAGTEQEAERLARPMDIVRIDLLSGHGEHPLLSPEAAAHRTISSQEQELLGDERDRALGTPRQVARRLAEIADRFGADELMLVTSIYDVADRIASLEGVASRFAESMSGASRR